MHVETFNNEFRVRLNLTLPFLPLACFSNALVNLVLVTRPTLDATLSRHRSMNRNALKYIDNYT